jgi:hypothetical protein
MKCGSGLNDERMEEQADDMSSMVISDSHECDDTLELDMPPMSVGGVDSDLAPPTLDVGDIDDSEHGGTLVVSMNPNLKSPVMKTMIQMQKLRHRQR